MNSKDHQLTETTNSQSTETTKSNLQTNIIIAKFLILLTVVVLLFLCSGCLPTNAAPANDGSTIKITYPSNASLVNIQETVTGTAGNITEGQKLWILVYPLTANKFYPQSGNVNIINGEWSLTVGIGTKENVGETFKIIAVLAADKESNEELTNYINTGPSTGWPGMDSIPIGAKVVDEVTVTRLNPEINITYPSNATSVNMQETVTGTAKNIPSEYKVWILVHPLATTKLYPQNGNVNIINGKWLIPIGIGDKGNAGETFEIMAVLANQKAHEELTNYINTGKNTSNWPGIDSIPDGANVYYDVTVIRKTDPTVNITSPLNTVKISDTITGTAKYIPDGQAVWIIIYPHKAHKYYPQNKVDIQNENWELQAQFGQKNNDSEKFDMIAVLADQNAQNEFTAYLDKSNSVQKWEGIQALPNVTQELDRVTVTRIGDLLPVADFNANPTSGDAPLAVQFTDLSQNATGWNWNFGDGATSIDPNPSHTYSAEGTYNVNLVASNANGTTQKTATITVQSPSISDEGSSGGSSHSSGGSSGGGGGSPESQTNVQVKELSQAQVSYGKPVMFYFEKNATCVVYVSFDAKKNAGKITAIAEQLKGKSTRVSELNSGEVYKYFNLWVGNSGFATSKNIEKPELCFKVEKSWLQDKKINHSSITLNRYNDNKWSQLPATLLKEDDQCFYFTAPPSEFSFFAITGKKTQHIINLKDPDVNLEGSDVKDEQTTGQRQKSNSSGNGSTKNSETGSIKTPGFETVYGIVSLLAIFCIKK
jgi:PGF-pre-PGF domain-containing protein